MVFLRGMSCKTQLIEATYDWTNILNKGKGQIDVILLEFIKAFDVVPHHRLPMKICMYGITSKTRRWINNFLGNRTPEVDVNRSKSERGMNKSGVPQATVLGPLLLLLSTPLHQCAASRVQHPKSCGSQQSLPPGGKERLHFVGIRPEVQARKGGW